MRRAGRIGRGSAALAGAALLCGVAGAAAAGDAFETYGNIGRFAIPLAAGAVSVWHKDAEGLFELGTTTALAAGATYGLKQAIDREGPDGDGHSFPSGHATLAFAGASYLHYRYGWEYGLPAYALAAAVGASRVEADEHWVTDVVAGAVIANLSALVMTDAFDDDVVLVPFIDSRSGTYGASIATRW